jgi:hypothetical protein
LLKTPLAVERQGVADEGLMKQSSGPEHEQAMVKAFIVTRKQQRWLDFLSKPKRRKDILRTLPHLKDLDERFLLRVPAPQSTSVILEMLEQRRAPEQCYVVSESAGLDARTLPLKQALQLIVGMSAGTLVSCIPGRLGYFEGEASGERFILQRGAA